MKAVANGARRDLAELRTLALPLGAYLGVTLAAPALNGAWQSAAFGGHAVEVLATVASFVVGVGTVALLRAFWSPRPALGENTLGGNIHAGGVVRGSEVTTLHSHD